MCELGAPKARSSEGNVGGRERENRFTLESERLQLRTRRTELGELCALELGDQSAGEVGQGRNVAAAWREREGCCSWASWRILWAKLSPILAQAVMPWRKGRLCRR